MKRIQFYYCKECGNVLMSTGASEVICCGRKLMVLPEQKADAAHRAETELQDGEWYVTVPHVMTKEHFLVFAAWVSYDRTLLIRLYPEQNAEFRMPMLRKGTLYLCCSEHGLFRQTIKDNIN